MRKWVQIILCLLLSAGIWFIHNLSQKYVGIVSTSIIASSDLDGYAELSSTEATITAQISASGFKIYNLNHKHKAAKIVRIQPTDLQKIEENTFILQNSALLRYTKDLFGEGVNIESFISQAPSFNFANTIYKKVPVRKICSISYSPQYMATTPFTVKPDSVIVYGEEAHLDNIEYINTQHLNLKNLSSSVHGKLNLEIPNTSIRLNTQEVTYSLEVSRYVEINTEVKVEQRNVPLNKSLVVLPSKVNLTLRCAFPSNAQSLENITVYVDYNDFIKSINGICIPHIEGLSKAVYSYSSNPQILNCVSITR